MADLEIFIGEKKFIFPLSMLLGTLICYVFGTVWHCVVTESSLASSAAVCILPFIPGDIIKIAVAATISVALRPRLSRIAK